MNHVEDLLESAQRALTAGNQLVARGYLRRAANAAPDRLDIWRELLDVTEVPTDRLRCLERIVELDPEDEGARQALENLRAEVDEAQEEDDPTAQHEDEDPTADLEALRHEREPVDVDPSVLAPPVLVDAHPHITDAMRQEWDEAVTAGRALYCINHPQRETTLRCNSCGAPVCASCVVRTPVGFRCKDCVKAQQASFYTAHWYDYVIAGVISLVLAIAGAALTSLAGWFFAIIISPIAGGLIGGIVHWAIGRRRGRWIWLLTGGCIVLGALIVLGAISLFNPYSLLSIGIFAGMATGAAVGVLRLGRQR